MAAVLSSLHLTAAAVTALEQLTEIVRKQGQVGRDPFKTASRLDEARRDLRRKQPVHQYRLLGLTQACTDAEVSSSDDHDMHLAQLRPALSVCSGRPRNTSERRRLCPK